MRCRAVPKTSARYARLLLGHSKYTGRLAPTASNFAMTASKPATARSFLSNASRKNFERDGGTSDCAVRPIRAGSRVARSRATASACLRVGDRCRALRRRNPLAAICRSRCAAGNRQKLNALSRGLRHVGTLARVAQPKRVRLQGSGLFTGTRHRPGVAALKQRVVLPANCDTRSLRRLRAPAPCPRSGLLARYRPGRAPLRPCGAAHERAGGWDTPGFAVAVVPGLRALCRSSRVPMTRFNRQDARQR